MTPVRSGLHAKNASHCETLRQRLQPVRCDCADTRPKTHVMGRLTELGHMQHASAIGANVGFKRATVLQPTNANEG